MSVVSGRSCPAHHCNNCNHCNHCNHCTLLCNQWGGPSQVGSGWSKQQIPRCENKTFFLAVLLLRWEWKRFILINHSSPFCPKIEWIYSSSQVKLPYLKLFGNSNEHSSHKGVFISTAGNLSSAPTCSFLHLVQVTSRVSCGTPKCCNLHTSSSHQPHHIQQKIVYHHMAWHQPPSPSIEDGLYTTRPELQMNIVQLRLLKSKQETIFAVFHFSLITKCYFILGLVTFTRSSKSSCLFSLTAGVGN